MLTLEVTKKQKRQFTSAKFQNVCLSYILDGRLYIRFDILDISYILDTRLETKQGGSR